MTSGGHHEEKRSRPNRHSLLLTLPAVAALGLAGAMRLLASGIHLRDESWFLQVLHRIVSGDVLYRDIFYGVTPLTVYVTLPFVRLFGSEVIVLKGLSFAYCVLMVLALYWVARELGVRRRLCLVIPLAWLAVVRPFGGGTFSYNQFVSLIAILGLGVTVHWLRSVQRKNRFAFAWLVGAGIMAGLCFCIKQNVGVYTLAAVSLVVLVHRAGNLEPSRPPMGSLMLSLWTTFAVTTGLILLPVLWSGGMEMFLEYGFLAKGMYVRLGSVPYWEGLQKLKLWFLIPPMALGFLLLTWMRECRGARVRTVAVLAFAGVAFLSVFPRADKPHLEYAQAASLLGLAYAWDRLGLPRLGRRADLACDLMAVGVILSAAIVSRPIRLMVPTYLFLALAYVMGSPRASTWPRRARLTLAPLFLAVLMLWGASFYKYVGSLYSGRFAVTSIPHFRGLPLMKRTRDHLQENLSCLRNQVVSGESMLILSPNAAFYYLAGDIRNPVSSDYPLATTLGRHGEEAIVTALEHGAIDLVCYDEREFGTVPPTLRPARLIRYVTESMVPGSQCGCGTIYRQPRP